MKASDYIVQTLRQAGTDKIFGYVGGMITHLVDSIAQSKGVEMVNTLHEQGAAFAAEGYARQSGRLGAAIATSGPGATNLMTGIGSCFFDSVPVLFITGQVNTYEYKGDLPIRQRGFQETEIVSMVKGITKYAAYVGEAKDLRYALEKAVFVAQNARKGPVLLDIPMNIQRADLDFKKQKGFVGSREWARLSKRPACNAAKAAAWLGKARRPVVMVGGGVRAAGASALLAKFLRASRIPAVSSLMGKDSVAQKESFGFIGTYGNRYANFALANADVVLILGSRLDSRQTGTNAQRFARAAKIIRVDVDANELAHTRVPAALAVRADIGDFLTDLLKRSVRPEMRAWRKTLAEWADRYSAERFLDGSHSAPNQFLKTLSEVIPADATVCADVGQHQMWTAQSLGTGRGRRVLFSGGMGSMGFALPAAIGALLGGAKAAYVIAGDGGIQMNIQELEVVRRRRLNLKIIVMNNACLGMVRQFQEQYFGGRCLGTVTDYSCPDLAKVAAAYGIASARVPVGKADKKLFARLCKPGAFFLDLTLDKDSSVEPKLGLNMPIEDMHPRLTRAEFLKTMIVPPAEESLRE